MRSIGAVIGGGLFIVALFAGWWAIDRVQEHLPGPVNAVIDSVQNGGSPYGGPIIQPVPSGGAASPLDACPEFADDVREVEQVAGASATVSPAQAEANNELIERELDRMEGGGAPQSLSSTGVAAALRDQADALDAMAAALSSTGFRTAEASSLATGLAAAAGRVSDANRRFIAQNTGTRAQWQAWVESVGGPLAQVGAASKGFMKCPA
jgi:hypothetical protein